MVESKAGVGDWRRDMLRIGRGIAAIVFVLGALFGLTAARQYDIKLVVTVTDCVTRQPIQGALVNVRTAAVARGSQNLAVTNEDGQAVIEPLRVGDVDHTVEVSAEGYQSVTRSQYMESWSTVNMNICLQPVAPPPTETPTVTPTLEATLTPSATSTDDGQAARCSDYLAEQLKGLVAPEDGTLITGGVNGAAKCMLNCRAVVPQPTAQGSAPAELPGWAGISYGQFYACFQGCLDVGYYRAAASAILANDTSPGKMIGTLADLLGGAEGAQACGDPGAFVFQLVKQLAIQGAPVNLVAAHSPVNIWVTDQQGKRAGFLEDGSLVEEIAGARVVISGESKYMLIPVIPELKVDLKGSGKGTMTVELAYTKGEVVQDVAFYDIPVALGSTGSVNLTPSQPALELTTPELGTQSSPPGRFEEIPVIPAPAREATSVATAEPAVLPTLEPVATPTPERWLTDQQLKMAGAVGGACCLGLLLAGGLVGAAIWMRRRARQRETPHAAPRGKECPRCGALCQADARFCYKCGQSFVQVAAPPAAKPQPAVPLPVTPPRPAQAVPPPAPPLACTKCGQALRGTSKFCPKCGQPTGR